MATLTDEINAKSKEIFAESYSMSLGELISLYKDRELDIHPEFQRFFRWTNTQKTRLIESFLLNIPVPSIFVSQREDGVWDVVDGLQRLSTIFQFVGIFEDHNGNLLSPLTLEATDLLPSLANKTYEGETGFTETEKRFLKRAKIDVVIIKKESDKSGKYEMFQRLNTGGTSLSDQEVRNCLMVMINAPAFERFLRMANNSNFKNTINLAEKLLDERYDLELLTRFICLRHESIDNIKSISDLNTYLNARIIEIFNDADFNWDEEESVFNQSFGLIDSAISDRAFCKYYRDRDKFSGQFLISAYEIVAISLGRVNGNVPQDFNLEEAIKAAWNRTIDENIIWTGHNASGRLPKTLKLGVEMYGQEI